MALWLGVPEPPPQLADLFDEFAPAEDEAEEMNAYEDEAEEEEEEEEDDDEVVPVGFLSRSYNELTLLVAGGVHVFLSASPDKVEAALSLLRGRELLVPPASGNKLSMSYWSVEYEFDSVTADEVQDVLLWLGGREMMVRRISVLLSFQGVGDLFDPVSHYKVQAALSLLAGMELTVSTVVPPAWASWRKQPLHCEISVSHSASPDKVQAALSLLGGRELNPGIGEVEFPTPLASLMRFREKLKEQNFDKKIRYTFRKKVALRMQRNRCQFTSSRPKPDEATSELATPDGSPNRELVEARHLSAAE